MIVVFGSINIDFIVSLESLPAPGATVLGPGYRTLPGGKGANQAAAAAKAGARVRFAGAVGRDMFAELPLAALKVADVDTAAVRRVEGAATGAAFICVDGAGENQIAVTSGANNEARAEQVPDDWLTLETTSLLQMELPAAESWRLAERAHARSAWVLLNLAPALPVPVGVLAAGLDAGAGLSEALRYTSVAGGLACEREGTMPSLPGLKQIEARLSELPAPKSL